eukprot:COSAG03_NODE_444_length_7850_cov_26.836858_5_plen_67_part_00
MSHASWRPVELNTIHEFAREMIGAGMAKEAVKEMAGAMEMLDELGEEQLVPTSTFASPTHFLTQIY